MPAVGEGVTLDEAAEILGCSRSTVQRLVARGLLDKPHQQRHRQLDRRQVEELAARRWARPHQDSDTDHQSTY